MVCAHVQWRGMDIHSRFEMIYDCKCMLCIVALWREVGQGMVLSKSDSRGRYGCLDECTAITTLAKFGGKMQSNNDESTSVAEGISVPKPIPFEDNLELHSILIGKRVQLGYAKKSPTGGRFSFYILDNERYVSGAKEQVFIDDDATQ